MYMLCLLFISSISSLSSYGNIAILSLSSFNSFFSAYLVCIILSNSVICFLFSSTCFCCFIISSSFILFLFFLITSLHNRISSFVFVISSLYLFNLNIFRIKSKRSLGDLFIIPSIAFCKKKYFDTELEVQIDNDIYVIKRTGKIKTKKGKK